MFDKNSRWSGVGKAFLVLVCIVLFVLFAGIIVWSSRDDAAAAKELQKLAESKAGEQTAEKANEPDKKDTVKDEIKEDAKEKDTAEEEDLQEEETAARGVVCWGDDLINGEDSNTYSYRAVLQKLLNENNYDLPVLDKTIQGGGTLSMMTMAGVPAEKVQEFINTHKAGANGMELYITETGIRDLTPEQTDRSDADCIPVICMGYYGGWNHDCQELIEQQQCILDTFQNQDRFIIIGTAPIDASVDTVTLDNAMREKWGEHYISAADVTISSASYDGQAAIAKAVFQKLEDLEYIAK